MVHLEWDGRQYEDPPTQPRLLRVERSLSSEFNSNNVILGSDSYTESIKAYFPLYANRIRCIFLELDDSVLSDLNELVSRVEHLSDFLREDGCICVCVSDKVNHYVKILLDELLGRRNFKANCVWELEEGVLGDCGLREMHAHLLVYARRAENWVSNLLPQTEKQKSSYKNRDSDPRGPWASENLTAPIMGALGKAFRKNGVDGIYNYPVTTPSGKIITPYECFKLSWRVPESTFKQLLDSNQIHWPKNGESAPRKKVFLKDVPQGIKPLTLWLRSQYMEPLPPDMNEISKIPSTKWEIPVVHRMLKICADDGDIVMDASCSSPVIPTLCHHMGLGFICAGISESTARVASELLRVSPSPKFCYQYLGELVLSKDGFLNENLDYEELASYIWKSVTGKIYNEKSNRPLIGVNEGRAYYLLCQCRGDPENTVTVLSPDLLRSLTDEGRLGDQIFVYARQRTVGQYQMHVNNITFKQIPYDL